MALNVSIGKARETAASREGDCWQLTASMTSRYTFIFESDLKPMGQALAFHTVYTPVISSENLCTAFRASLHN